MSWLVLYRNHTHHNHTTITHTSNTSNTSTVPYIVDDFLKGMTPAPPEWAINATAENARVAPVWSAVRGAVLAHSIANASAPGVRNSSHDFVREGARVEAATTAFVRRQLAAFMAAAPAYPQGTFSGRGIVTIGGGMRYIIPAWMAVHQLRHLGCRLPIEMWYPPSEWPPPEAVAAFARLGVVSRRMDFEGLNITAFKEPPKARKGAPAPPPPSAAESMARFTFKVAALLLSRFEEVRGRWWTGLDWWWRTGLDWTGRTEWRGKRMRILGQRGVERGHSHSHS